MQNSSQVDDENAIPSLKNEDFESITVRLSFINITTKTEVSDGKRYMGDHLEMSKDQNLKIDLVEFREDGLVIEVPTRSGATGHQLSLKIWTEGANPNLEMTSTVTVARVERLSKTRDQFELSFNEFNSKEWKSIQGIFLRRQSEIEEFLNAARGV